MELHQLDIKTAFLNGDLEEIIYMQQPKGYAEGGPGMVCHLRRALYALKQAGGGPEHGIHASSCAPKVRLVS